MKDERVRQFRDALRRVEAMRDGAVKGTEDYDDILKNAYQAEDKLFRDFGRTSCLNLCETLHSTIPLELRQRIYLLVLGPKTTGNVRQKPISAKPKYIRGEIDVGKWILSDRGRFNKLPWWSPQWTGAYISVEMIETWYREQTFFLHGDEEEEKDDEDGEDDDEQDNDEEDEEDGNGNGDEQQPHFLSTNHFGQEFAPADFVRHVRLIIYLAKTPADKIVDLENAIGSLRNKNAKVDISVYLDAVGSGEVDIKSNSTMLVSTIHRLQEKGFNMITVQGLQSEQDLTDLFNDPKIEFGADVVEKIRCASIVRSRTKMTAVKLGGVLSPEVKRRAMLRKRNYFTFFGDGR